MNLTLHKSTLVTIYSNDPMFHITDGFIRAPRAGFHVLPECPQEYKMIIGECINRGWLKPVAHMHDYEKTFALLKNE